MAKEDANLAISDQAGLVADTDDASVSVSQGEHEFRLGCSGGTEGLDCEIGERETWIVDSAATKHMIPNPVSISNYRECNGVVRVANGVALPIEGVDDVLMNFQSGFGETDLQLLNVAFVCLLVAVCRFFQHDHFIPLLVGVGKERRILIGSRRCKGSTPCWNYLESY